MVQQPTEKEKEFIYEIRDFCNETSTDDDVQNSIFDENMVEMVLDGGKNEQIWLYIFTNYRTKNTDIHSISKRRLCAHFKTNPKNGWDLWAGLWCFDLLETKKKNRRYLVMRNITRWDYIYKKYKKNIKGMKNG